MHDLVRLGRWNDDIRNLIIAHGGSIAKVPSVSSRAWATATGVFSLCPVWVMVSVWAGWCWKHWCGGRFVPYHPFCHGLGAWLLAAWDECYPSTERLRANHEGWKRWEGVGRTGSQDQLRRGVGPRKHLSALGCTHGQQPWLDPRDRDWNGVIAGLLFWPLHPSTPALSSPLTQLADIPSDIKELYRTVWEVKGKDLVDMAASRCAFVDQVWTRMGHGHARGCSSFVRGQVRCA